MFEDSSLPLNNTQARTQGATANIYKMVKATGPGKQNSEHEINFITCECAKMLLGKRDGEVY